MFISLTFRANPDFRKGKVLEIPNCLNQNQLSRNDVHTIINHGQKPKRRSDQASTAHHLGLRTHHKAFNNDHTPHPLPYLAF